MPIVLQPLPRRIHRTHENFALGRPVALSVPSGASDTAAANVRESLEPLFPEILVVDSAEPAAPGLRFALFDDPAGVPEEVPPEVASQAYRIEVSSDRIEVTAGSETGWLSAARQLLGLRDGDELTGIEILDWPSFPDRQIDLDWPAGSVSAATYETLLALMAIGRLNRLGLHGSELEQEVPEEARDQAQRLGIQLVTAGADPSFRLLERPSLSPHYSQRLPALVTAAAEAESAGQHVFAAAFGFIDAQTSLESLAYGILCIGDVAWNPRKSDLKAFRRAYSLRRFGFDSRAPQQIMEALEEGAVLAAGSGGDADSTQEPADLFDAGHVSGLTRPEELAAELERRASAALAAMGPIQPDSEERAAALQGLQWTAQRLRVRGRLIGTTVRVRDLYRSAYVAAASPKAVSDRLLRAADILENEARGLDDHRGEWHALWRRERLGPHDPDTETRLRATGEALLARAARLRELRNRYIQTGALPSPAEERMERAAARLTTGIIPARLPPQPSPAWWPEGGAARVRVDVNCPAPAADIPWGVQADFRALAGEVGAFNIRSVRLVPLTESDEAGPERPCQLLRGGFAFLAEPGRRSYHLYLDPEPAGDSGFREVRASQSRRAIRLENRHMSISLSPASGFIDAWHLVDPDMDLIAGDINSPDMASAPAVEWRLRLIETGPLLARARAEHPDGRIRQFDLAAGQSWIGQSANSSEEELLLPFPERLRSGQIEWMLGTESGVEHGLADRTVTGQARWGGLRAPEGLTIGAVLPEGTASFSLAADALHVQGSVSGQLLMFAGRELEPGQALAGLVEAFRQPPQVWLGIFEYRRVREF